MPAVGEVSGPHVTGCAVTPCRGECLAREKARADLAVRLQRYEDAVCARERARVARERASEAINAAKIAYGDAMDAESKAKDEVLAVRSALREAVLSSRASEVTP